MKPHLNGPFSPDLAHTIDNMSADIKSNDYPAKLDVGLIGSCTNSSYEDISRAASIARQAADKNLKAKADFIITPGSEQVRFTIERDGFIDDFKKIGGVVMANACGPCIGQWDRPGADKGLKNSIVTSFNRNFAKRADGNPNTYAFVASPETVTALAIAGELGFNPTTDSLTNENGEKVMLDIPSGFELPPNGFDVEDPKFKAPSKDGSGVVINVKSDSERLQLLTPFDAWDGNDKSGMKLLIKA